jgi:DinB family protein
MQLEVKQAVEVLERTPAVVAAMFRSQSQEWLQCRIKPGTFSPRDVLGHLIFGEITDWIPRARIILECGAERPFDPFDRFGFERLMEGKSVEELLEEFAERRKQNLQTLASLELDEERLELAGTHPELGRVTLRQLLAAWVVHDLNHIAQIARIMSNQYAAAVGPWREYLSILQ